MESYAVDRDDRPLQKSKMSRRQVKLKIQNLRMKRRMMMNQRMMKRRRKMMMTLAGEYHQPTPTSVSRQVCQSVRMSKRMKMQPTVVEEEVRRTCQGNVEEKGLGLR